MSEDFPLGKTFYVMRHAETDDNLKGLASGKAREPKITENGVGQAICAGEILKKLNNAVGIVVTSEMERTKETARIACDNGDLRNITHITDAGINERAYGIMEGFSEKRRREIKKVGGFVDGEESKENLRKRVVNTVKNHLNGDKTPLFVTHGGAILRLIGEALGGENIVDRLKEQERLAKNCDIYEFTTPSKKGEKWTVNLLTLDENREINRRNIEMAKRIVNRSNGNRNGIGI